MAFRTLKSLLRGRASRPLSPASPKRKTLRVAPHSDLKIVDPIWTTALISVNHGYMVYDTLFALDGKLNPQPQMVERHEMSADKLTWTFTLRDGLEWHDGKPVTAEDCIASIKRWGARDTMGQKLLSYVADFSAPDAKTIRMSAEGAVRPGDPDAGEARRQRAVHDAEARRRDRSHQADHRLRRLRSVHLQAGRMAPGREGGLPEESQIQAARRAGLGTRRRQGRQGRPRRMDLDRRRADAGQRAAQGRGRYHRGAAARPAAAARRRQERRAVRLESAGPPVRASASTCCTSRSTIRRCARRSPMR